MARFAGYTKTPTSVYTTPQYGEKEYEEMFDLWRGMSSKYSDLISETIPDVREAATSAKGLRDYYQPGGGYGEGLREEAKEEVGKGVARTSGQMVASGMSSLFGSRGVNVLAGAELSKLYKNIEDTRNQLLMQAFTPYAQMIQTLGQLAGASGQIMASAPKRTQYVTPGMPQRAGVRFV